MPRHFIDHQVQKGRGTASNRAGRFETLTSEKVDDGWYGEEEGPKLPEETVLPDRARTVISSPN